MPETVNPPQTTPVSGTVATTVADGANVVEGATTDAAVSSDTTGTLSGKLRGLVKILADVWDSTNHLLKVTKYDQSGTIYRGGTAYTVQHAFLDASASGATQVVAASGGKQILVTSYSLSANAAVNVYFKSHTAGQISATKYFAANGGATKARDVDGVFAPTTVSEALDVNLSAAVNVGVDVNYILI